MTHVSIIISGFLLLTLGVGYFSGRKTKTTEDFAVSHRKYSTPAMVATIFATVIGGGSTIGVVEKCYSFGFLYFLAFFGMAFNRLLVGYYLAPRMTFFSKKYTTLPQIMEEYYGPLGLHLTALSAILVSVGSVGTQTFVLSHILSHFLGISAFWGALMGCGVLLVYSSFGGMRSVIATDILQFSLILTLIPLLLTTLTSDVGGGAQVIHSLVDHASSDTMNYWKLTAVFFGLLIGAADPSFLQRLLVSRDGNQARQSTLITGYVSLVFYVLVGTIGSLAFTVMPGFSGENIFSHLVENYFSSTLMALIVCGIVSAVMSSADSDLNMVGISVASDHLKNLKLSPSRRLLIARAATFFLGMLAVFVALRAKSILDIIIYAFSFWAPAALIPLAAGILGVSVPKKWMISGVVLGGVTTLLWEIFLESSTHVDGLVPGILLHFCFFSLRAQKNDFL